MMSFEVKMRQACMRYVFRGLMYLEVLKQEERFGLRVWRLSDREKGMTNVFSCYKLTGKLYIVIKCQTTVEVRYLEANKHQTRCHCCF